MELIERVKNKSLDGHMESMEVHNFNVALAASRLAAASIITSIEELYIDHMNEDFSSVRNLSHLIRIVKNGVYLTYLTIKEFSAYFSHICCKELDFLFHEEIHTDKDIDSLTKVLNDRVEKFRLGFGHHINFPYIENYDGRGKCHEINFEYGNDIEDEVFESDLPKIQEWAGFRGWTIEVINDTPHTDLMESQIINIRRN